MTEILTQAYNPATGVYETFEREPGTAADLEMADLSADDLGCEPGTLYRVVLVDDEDNELAERFVTATGPARPYQPPMQRYELEAWLGDDHELSLDQLNGLLDIANDIEREYPDQEDADLREAALTGAYRAMRGEHNIACRLGQELLTARLSEARALAALRQAALYRIPNDLDSEKGFAEDAGVDRMTVRKWLGKR